MQRAFRRLVLPYKLIVVKDGQQAIDYLNGKGLYADRNQFPVPALFFLDLKMPKASGLEVLEFIRRNDNIRRLPTIILSSSNEDADVRHAYQLGANSYIVKPPEFEDLVKLVRSTIEYWFFQDLVLPAA